MRTLKQQTTLFATLVGLLLFSVPVFAFAQSASDANFVHELLWIFVNNVFGWMVSAGGVLLNEGINTFVVGFGNQFLTTGVGVVVDSLWVNVRDLFNLTFIFGLVYIGFKMILNSDDSNTRRWLVSLILAALLVNFSLFITKFVVDISNVLGSEIAQSAFLPDPNTRELQVSDSFMDIMGLQTTWGLKVDTTGLDGSSNKFAYIFGTAILFMVTGFVFAAGGVLLIIRYVALIIYMIFSPLMFLGWVFPQLQSVTTKYWRGFLGRAFFAPLYILLIFFSLKVLQSYHQAAGTKNFQAALSSNGDNMISSFTSSIVPFIVTCIFLIASLTIASKMGAEGAGAAMKIGNNLQRRVRRGAGVMAGGATAGLAARGLRNTVGRGAYAYTQSDKGQRRAASSLIGRTVFKAAQGTAGASFDARRVSGVGKAIGIGEGAKGGFTQTIKDVEKKEKQFADDLGKEEIYDATGAIKPEFKEQIINDIEQNEQRKLTETAHATAVAAATAAETVRQSTLKEKAAATSPVESKIKDLRTRLNNETNPLEKASLEKEIESANTELVEIEKRFEENVQAVNNRAAQANTEAKQAEQALIKAQERAEKVAKAKAVYGRQIAYMNQLDPNTDFFASKIKNLTGATGGAGAGLTVGSLLSAPLAAAGVGAIAGATGVSAYNSRRQYARKALQREYGADGLKKIEKEKKKDNLKILADELKKESGEENNNRTEKKPDSNNDEE